MVERLNEALSQKLIGHRDKMRSVLINVCGTRARSAWSGEASKSLCEKIPFFRCERLQLIVDNRIVKATWQHIIW